MKLHYFDRASADADDHALIRLKEAGLVPEGCLLGGVPAELVARQGKLPCAACGGPRAKCGGWPARSEADAAQGAERARLQALLLGEDAPLPEALRRALE